MSLIDPAETRRQREAARRGSGLAVVVMVIGLVVTFAGGVMMMRAMIGFAEIEAGTEQPPWAIFLMVVGLPAIIVGIPLHLGGASRYSGRLAAAPVVGPLTVMLAGLAAGCWWGLLTTDGLAAVWRIVTIALTALTVLSLVLGALGRRRRRLRRSRLDTLVRTGRVVPGVVTEIAEIDASSGGLIGPITVKFTDDRGADRWVQKIGQWKRAALPRNGDPAAVLFDPADPGDTDRIWVGPAGSRSAAEFTAWHS